MKEFIDTNGGIIATIVVVALAFNAFLSGVSLALEKIKDKTATDKDNKAYEFIGKILNITKWVVDFLSANNEHKKVEPPK